MTWREDSRRVTMPDGRRLIGASFRGVPFFVESVEASGGRRAVVHEFPLRDDPFVEDLGRSARGFRVEGYVIGDDYLEQKEALITAAEGTEGPGELVLPQHGTKRAVCIRWNERNARADGGMAVVVLEFAEAPAQAVTPTEVVDAAEQVDDAADAAIEATETELVEQYDVSGLPAFALESAQTALTNATEAVGEKLAPVVSAPQELAQLTSELALLTAQATSLVRDPAEALGRFRDAITAIVETAGDAPFAVLDAFYEAYFADLGTTVVATTATRERELTNQEALIGALRRVLAIEAARLAPLVEYASIEEATEARDKIAELLEEQAGGAGDTAYPALVDLRSQLLRAVPGGRAFARVVTVTRKAPIPSLLLTYQLYGSVDNEADVIARNSIRHPGFVFGDLKVLSDG